MRAEGPNSLFIITTIYKGTKILTLYILGGGTKNLTLGGTIFLTLFINITLPFHL